MRFCRAISLAWSFGGRPRGTIAPLTPLPTPPCLLLPPLNSFRCAACFRVLLKLVVCGSLIFNFDGIRPTRFLTFDANVSIIAFGAVTPCCCDDVKGGVAITLPSSSFSCLISTNPTSANRSDDAADDDASVLSRSALTSFDDDSNELCTADADGDVLLLPPPPSNVVSSPDGASSSVSSSYSCRCDADDVDDDVDFFVRVLSPLLLCGCRLFREI